MNKKYYKLYEDRWELPDFDEWKVKKYYKYTSDPNYSPLEWKDFDNSDINWSGMSYRTKEERERDNNIIKELRDFYNNTEYVTGEDKLKQSKIYARLSFPRWSTKTKKYYKDIIEYRWKDLRINLNEDNTDEIRRLIKYYPEYNPSKYLFRNWYVGEKLSGFLSCIIEELFMTYNGEELVPIDKYLFWNGKYLRYYDSIERKYN